MTTEMFQGLSERSGSCQGKDSLEMCTSFSLGENLDYSHHHDQQSQGLFYSTKFNNLLRYSLSFANNML